jgi:hypothetical protein
LHKVCIQITSRMQNSTKIQWIVRNANKAEPIVNCLKTQAYS